MVCLRLDLHLDLLLGKQVRRLVLVVSYPTRTRYLCMQQHRRREASHQCSIPTPAPRILFVWFLGGITGRPTTWTCGPAGFDLRPPITQHPHPHDDGVITMVVTLLKKINGNYLRADYNILPIFYLENLFTTIQELN